MKLKIERRNNEGVFLAVDKINGIHSGQYLTNSQVKEIEGGKKESGNKKQSGNKENTNSNKDAKKILKSIQGKKDKLEKELESGVKEEREEEILTELDRLEDEIESLEKEISEGK